MKTLTILFIAVFCVVSVYGQVNRTHNGLRPGDTIIKQQVEYVDPGEAGNAQLWDFSNLKTINQSYTLSYSIPPLLGDSLYIMGGYSFKKKDVREDELIVGTEHHTMYYYRQREDTLLLLGHENPTVRLTYTSPFLITPYPLSAGQVKASAYKSKGVYSGTVNMQTSGDITVSADAYGKLILPTGDTLSPVLRTKALHTIQEMQGTPARVVETHRWYTKGYRYPVFETIRNTDISDIGNPKDIFKTAFYYPPQDHLYIDEDPENLALLEDMWDLEKNKTIASDNENTGKEDIKTVSLEDIMDCKIYPNPVESQMTLEYTMKKEAKVSFQLYTIGGNPVKLANAKQRTTGTYSETIDCSNLRASQYVLRIMADSLFVNQIIIKK